MKTKLLTIAFVLAAIFSFAQADFTCIINLDKVKGDCRTGDCKGGKGKKEFDNGMIYQGFWFKKKMHGKGELYLKDHSTIHKIEANFSEGIINGTATLHLKDNSDVISKFEKSAFVKATKKLYPNKENYFVGDFVGLIPSKGEKVMGVNKWKGTFENEELIGNGILYKNNVQIYVGNFVEGKQDGIGTEFLENGTIYYTGNWKKGKKSGMGEMFNQVSKIYDGYFSNDVFDGEGTFYYDNGTKKHEGEWLKGQENGKGKSYDDKGNIIYEGDWKETLFSGNGIEYFSNRNKKYKGNFLEGFYNGEGTSYHENGKTAYVGEWENGNFNNYGKSFFENGKLAYEGGFYSAVKQGYGKEYNTEGQLIYQGYMQNNAMHGYGVHYSREGWVDYEGIWDNGALTAMDASKIDPVFTTEFKKTCKTMVLLKDTLFTSIERTEKFTGECISEHNQFDAMKWYANGLQVKELYYTDGTLKVKILNAPEEIITRYEYADEGKVANQVDFKGAEKLIYTERVYHTNGVLASNYTQNEDGSFTKNEFHTNGTPKITLIYTKDFSIKDGVYQQLDSLGNTALIQTYQNGTVVNTEEMK